MATVKATAKKSSSSPSATRAAGAQASGSKKSSAAKSAKQTAAAKRPASRTTARRNDALSLLIQDHKAVKKLFKQYEKLTKAEADGQQRQELARLICEMLKQHTQIEEEIFYPAARQALPKPDLLDEAEVEHASAKDLIAQIEASAPEEPLYDAKVHVLAEYVDHHVQEEEESMFPKLRRAGLDLVALGRSISQRKEQLTAGEGQEVVEPV